MGAKRDVQKSIGLRCKALRQGRGLSQMDIVRRFDFSLSHYQKIERGVLDPRLTTLRRLAECFGVSLSQMLKGV